jgi:multisubunit Na+/H+ antiporter MnhB subunit
MRSSYPLLGRTAGLLVAYAVTLMLGFAPSTRPARRSPSDCAAPTFRGGGLAAATRWLLVISGVLSLAGLSGAVTGDMNLRNIGIVGYVGVFLIATLTMAALFRRERS